MLMGPPPAGAPATPWSLSKSQPPSASTMSSSMMSMSQSATVTAQPIDLPSASHPMDISEVVVRFRVYRPIQPRAEAVARARSLRARSFSSAVRFNATFSVTFDHFDRIFAVFWIDFGLIWSNLTPLTGLPFDASDQVLRPLFEKYGAISSLDMSNVSKGFAFVVYDDIDSAVSAVREAGHMIDRRTLNVRFKLPRRR